MKGIRRDQYGFRAYVKVGDTQKEKRYPADTKASTMQAWRDETKVALRKRTPKLTGTFRADARTYLKKPTIQALGSYKSRICEIEAWLPLIGDLPRASLTRDQILAARERWLTDKYAPKTINHRVRALRHLYRTLDGPGTVTPCDGIKRLPEPKAQPVAVSPAIVRKVLKKLTDRQTKARFMVLVSTGQRPAQLMRAVRTDVDLRRRIWFVRSAKGGEAIPLPLTDDMVTAWRDFIAAKAFGAYDTSTHAKRLYEAGWPPDVRPYNAKHTVGILLAEAGADFEDIKDWFGHKDVKTTRIYTGFVASRLRSTSRLLAGRLGWQTRKRA